MLKLQSIPLPYAQTMMIHLTHYHVRVSIHIPFRGNKKFQTNKFEKRLEFQSEKTKQPMKLEKLSNKPIFFFGVTRYGKLIVKEFKKWIFIQIKTVVIYRDVKNVEQTHLSTCLRCLGV